MNNVAEEMKKREHQLSPNIDTHHRAP